MPTKSELEVEVRVLKGEVRRLQHKLSQPQTSTKEKEIIAKALKYLGWRQTEPDCQKILRGEA